MKRISALIGCIVMLSAVQQARAEDNSVTLYGVFDTGIRRIQPVVATP